MTFESFKMRIGAYLTAANATARIAGSREIFTAEFSEEDGRYFARISNGVKFRGNAISRKIETLWGSGHHAICPA